MDPDQLMQDGMQFASKAINHDQCGEYELAHFFYVEASEAILKAISINSELGTAKAKALQYVERAEFLQTQFNSNSATGLTRNVSQTAAQRETEQVEFLLSQALSEDEQGNSDTALSLYTDVIELCLERAKNTIDAAIKEKLNKWAMGALERAEALKSQKSNLAGQSKSKPAGSNVPNVSHLSLSDPGKSGKPRLSKAEIETLHHTSKINGKVYPPWLDVDLREKFAYRIPFSDPDGVLSLAPKQKSRLAEWVRPSDLCENPQMIYAVTSFSIKQTIVSDCSFVASLAISAAYERQFKKKLITTIIYPQSKDGHPVINPCGKYMVKLRVNGVSRKVIIDDTLPLGKDGKLLCSFSQNKDEFWVSLLEKAYMKVMGGYDFPGSNSNIDLHALTGWIPERQSLKSDSDKNILFDRLMTGLHQGDVLITAATGQLSDADADRAGLVTTHAYALLDMRSVQGKKLCQLKNPWSHLRWKGNFSETDDENWNPELERLLRYDRRKANEKDNGVFWIDLKSLLHFYDVLYMNWNPSLFPYKFTYHNKWKSAEGPIKDAYNVGDNPQYRLELQGEEREGIVWLLLTRHITERDDFAENREFITLHVYKSEGRRIYYPENKFIEGVKINSPHYLCKMNTPRGTSRYTIVISQYEKLHTIFYSLKVYSTVKFSMSPVPDLYSSKKRLTLSWTKTTAGGSTNNSTYESNPKIPLELIADRPANVLIKIEANRKFAVAAELRSTTGAYKKHSGDYKWGFLAFDLRDVPAGKYLIVPSTFLPGKEGPFFLEVNTSCAMKLNI